MLAGRIVAGPLVRLACERHLRDLETADERGFIFDGAAADHTMAFFEKYLRLPDTDDGHGQARPFILQPWQAFIVGSLFGWKWASGFRRFRNAYIEIGKGNGKTPLLAGIGLYGLTMDGEKAPEIYAAASDRDQAGIMFRDAVRMVDESPQLSQRVQKSGIQQVHNLAYGMGFFRPFSREQGAKSGTRPHMGLIDEVHEAPSPDIINKIKAGAKGNQNALFIEITNSGYDRTSICFQHHEHSRRVLEQSVEDDRWFAYVCTLDEGDDPLEDESCHIKVNPNLGVSIQREYLRDQVAAAKNIPVETNTVLRLNFCVWTQAQTRLIDMVKWQACRGTVLESILAGAPCYAGLDLGQTDDLCAFVLLWLLPDGRKVVKARFWLPSVALERFKNRPYEEWQRSGVLEITEGEATDFSLVQEAVRADCRKYGVRRVGYDRRFANQMAQNLTGAGIEMVDIPQGWALTEANRALLSMVLNLELVHDGNPILTWNAANAVAHVRDGAIRLDKEKSREKIDGIAALSNAIEIGVVRGIGASSAEVEVWA